MSVQAANISGMSALAIWCVTPTMLALTGAVPPFLIGGFSFLSAFILTAAWWICKGESVIGKFVMPARAYAVGIFGIAVYNALYIYAFKTGPVLEVNLLNYLWPAFLIIFGGLLQKNRPDGFALIGISCCFAGAFFIFESRGPLSFSGNHQMLFLGLLCGLMWGGYSALARFVFVNVDQTAVFFFIAGILMLGLHMAFEKTVWPAAALGWLMLISYSLARIAFFMWDYAMRHGQTRLLGSLSYFMPLVATLVLAAAGVVNPHSPRLLLGAALIISGCIVINLKNLMQNVAVVLRRTPA